MTRSERVYKSITKEMVKLTLAPDHNDEIMARISELRKLGGEILQERVYFHTDKDIINTIFLEIGFYQGYDIRIGKEKRTRYIVVPNKEIKMQIEKKYGC